MQELPPSSAAGPAAEDDDDGVVEISLNSSHTSDGHDQVSRANAEQMSTVFGASFNFINSIVGAGIIGLPFALKQCGFMTGVLMLSFVAFLVNRSVLMLIECGLKVGKLDLEDLSDHLLGPVGFYAALASMFIFSYGSQIAYLVIIGDTIPLVVQAVSTTDNLFCNRTYVLLLLSILIVLPLCLLKDMEALSKTSLLSIALDFLLVVVVISAAPSAARDQGIFLNRGDNHLYFINEQVFAGVGTMSFAFVCQHNSFIVFRSLRERTFSNWTKVVHGSVVFSYILCMAFSLVGYLSFVDETKGDLLNNFPITNQAVNAARILLAITMLFTYPMECFVSRHCVLAIIKRLTKRSAQNYMSGDKDDAVEDSDCAAVGRDDGSDDDGSDAGGEAYGSRLLSRHPSTYFDHMSALFRASRCLAGGSESAADFVLRICVTLLSFGSTLSIAIAYSDLGNVLSLTGALGASTVGYILPAFIYIRCNDVEFAAAVSSLWAAFGKNVLFGCGKIPVLQQFYLPIFMVIFGIVALIAGVSTVFAQ